MRKYLTAFLILFWIQGALGQDIQFSQFYANAIYLNPAFTGGLHTTRVAAHYRNQWTGLDAQFVTYLGSVDAFLKESNLGVGGYVLRDIQGNNTLSSTEVAFDLAYELPLSKYWTFRMGGQISIISRHLDYAQLRFPSQYTDDGLQSPSSVSHQIGVERVTFPDASFGGLVYNRNLWFGASGHHLNTPSQSFIQDNVNTLPIRWAFIGGYKIVLNRPNNGLQNQGPETSISPTVHYKTQGESDQFDIGAYFNYYPFLVGLWYRGIPVKRTENLQNNEAIIGMVGIKIKHWVMRYSYDYTVSTLNSAGTGGAHELSVSFRDFSRNRRKKKPQRRIPCPNFD